MWLLNPRYKSENKQRNHWTENMQLKTKQNKKQQLNQQIKLYKRVKDFGSWLLSMAWRGSHFICCS